MYVSYESPVLDTQSRMEVLPLLYGKLCTTEFLDIEHRSVDDGPPMGSFMRFAVQLALALTDDNKKSRRAMNLKYIRGCISFGNSLYKGLISPLMIAAANQSDKAIGASFSYYFCRIMGLNYK